MINQILNLPFGTIITVLIQGILEAFPISSSMHLQIFANALGYTPSIHENGIMHMGTSVAFMLILLPIITYMLKNIFNVLIWKIVFKLSIMIAPTLLVGLFINDIPIKLTYILIINIIAAIMLLFSLTYPETKSLVSLSIRSIMIISGIITLAFIPGVSRMGITFTALRFMNVKKFDALIISLLLGAPITMGAATIGLIKYNLSSHFGTALIIKSAIAGIFTFLFLKLTFKLLNRMWIFAIYRIIFSIVSLLTIGCIK